MRRIITFLAFCLLFLIMLGPCSSCAPSRYNCGNGHSYWIVKKDTGIERLTYFSRSWPHDQRMSTYRSLPMKETTFRRYYYWTLTARQ
jgi:hypothetical protein